MTTKLYASRDAIALGSHYTRHIEAMTVEDLHDKGDIAAELAWRDAEIERVKVERDATIRDVCSTDATTQTLFRELEQRAEAAEAVVARAIGIASSLRAAGLLQQATAIEDALAEAERKVRGG